MDTSTKEAETYPVVEIWRYNTYKTWHLVVVSGVNQFGAWLRASNRSGPPVLTSAEDTCFLPWYSVVRKTPTVETRIWKTQSVHFYGNTHEKE